MIMDIKEDFLLKSILNSFLSKTKAQISYVANFRAVPGDAAAHSPREGAHSEALLVPGGVPPLLVPPQQHVSQAGLAGASGAQHDKSGILSYIIKHYGYHQRKMAPGRVNIYVFIWSYYG